MTPVLSLLDWASARSGVDDDPWDRWEALHATSPLPQGEDSYRHAPDRNGYRHSLAWLVGDLDAPSLAASLSARGLAYRDGLGWLVDGSRVTGDEAGRLAADVLVATGDALPTLPEPGADRAWAHACGLGDVVEQIDRVTVWRRALRDTARELRNSSGARRAVLGLVRPHLDRTREAAPGCDRDAASAWLARFDADPAIRRADLGRAYGADGRPGDLSARALYVLAAERWSPPVHVRGYPTFRPRNSNAVRGNNNPA